MSLHLGIDSSTQSCSAVVIDVDRSAIVAEHWVGFDERLPQYGTENGVLPHEDEKVRHSSPQMWADALDLLFSDLAEQGLDLSAIRSIAGSGQQHGSVYLATPIRQWSPLDPAAAPGEQVTPYLSRATAPIWMDTSTSQECAEITETLGGPECVADLTGSCCFERFTGPQIRKFAKTEPEAYARTAQIHLVSSFIASLLAASDAPIDSGDGAGMNLMNIRTRQWAPEALAATAPELEDKLPPTAPSWTVVGALSDYWVQRHGLSPECLVAAWSGDNPNSLIGAGLVEPGKVCISLGTSDTYFGFMPEPRVDPRGEGHCFGSPTGDYMSLICFINGSLARERVAESGELTWVEFSAALERTPAGNRARLMLPWFLPEIVPHVERGGVHRFGLDADDVDGNVRAVVEAQMMSMRIHSQWMGVSPQVIYATGGGSRNRALLKVMADVHNATVYQFETFNSAALGAALRAAHAHALKTTGEAPPWIELVAPFTTPSDEYRLTPDPEATAVYDRLVDVYRACERRVLEGAADPEPMRQALAADIAP